MENSFYSVKPVAKEFLYEPHKVVFKWDNLTNTLPFDVVISINGNKLIAQSQIIDGVAVFERITRKPYNVDFSFTLRDKMIIQTITSNTKIYAGDDPEQNKIYDKINEQNGSSSKKVWIFPIDQLSILNSEIYSQDRVFEVENCILNALEIHKLIIEDIQFTTIAGSTDLPVKMKCVEDVYSSNSLKDSLILI